MSRSRGFKAGFFGHMGEQSRALGVEVMLPEPELATGHRLREGRWAMSLHGAESSSCRMSRKSH